MTPHPDTSGERTLEHRTVASDCPAAPDLPLLGAEDIVAAADAHADEQALFTMTDWGMVQEAFIAGARFALNGGKE